MTLTAEDKARLVIERYAQSVEPGLSLAEKADLLEVLTKRLKMVESINEFPDWIPRLNFALSEWEGGHGKRGPRVDAFEDGRVRMSWPDGD